MESAVLILPAVAEPHAANWSPAPQKTPQPKTEAEKYVDDLGFAKLIYGFLTAAFGLLGSGLFIYFAYCTCGGTDIVIAAAVLLLAAGSFVRYVLEC